MTDEDDKLTRRYRELAREEPPVAVDAALLAAAHRAVKARPFSQRWMGPVSIAAVLVLGIGVSLNMQRDRPGVEVAAPPKDYSASPSVLPEAPPVQSPAGPQRREDVAGAPAAPRANNEALKREAKPALKKEIAPAPTPPAELRAPPQPFAAARAKREMANAAPRPQPQAEPAANATHVQTEPAAELERIAALRTAGRHAEADKALDEFRRRFPDYRIPDPLWDRVRAR
jgi:hypothetical protein